MKAITFFGGAYSGVEQLAEKTASVLGCRLVRDDDLIEKAGKKYDFSVSDIRKSIYAEPPVPARFSSKSAQCVAAVKSVMTGEMKKGPFVFSGFLGELVPREMALHVLVTAGMAYRFQRVFRKDGLAGEEAAERIRMEGHRFFQWSHYLEEMEAWDPSICHVVVATDYMELSAVIEEITRVIGEKEAHAVRRDEAVEDFVLAAKVSAVMAKKKIPVAVSVRDSNVELTIVKPVLMLSRHEKRLVGIASAIPGVKEVRTRVGAHFHRADIVSKLEFEPSSERFLKSIEKKYTAIHQRVSGYRTPLMQEAEEIRLSPRI